MFVFEFSQIRAVETNPRPAAARQQPTPAFARAADATAARPADTPSARQSRFQGPPTEHPALIKFTRTSQTLPAKLVESDKYKCNHTATPFIFKLFEVRISPMIPVVKDFL